MITRRCSTKICDLSGWSAMEPVERDSTVDISKPNLRPHGLQHPRPDEQRRQLRLGAARGFLSSDRISGFGYGLGISVGVLLLITTITLMSYCCARANYNTSPSRSTADAPDVEAGLDEATLMSYPTVLYSEAKLREKAAAATSTASCCSICLADYKDTDVLRLLPDCGHLFHLKCVDLWLRSRPTCPVCRSSPLPSPLPTPLAEVIPLARQS